ncbi:MAG TPA: iron ABC transporter permease [Herpetosiphonaceae bacterium]|nr:iron ABC transporter permease [Herpetosiphonaceae bacterium]
MSSNRSALERAAPARRSRGRAARRSWLFPGLIAALAATLVLGLGIGAVSLGPAATLRALVRPATADPTAVTIVWDLRLARMLLAGLIGAGLASAGAGFQGLFRNPLADPFVVGASGGAALGATLAIVFDLPWRGFGLGPVPLAALVGALGAVALVFAVAEAGGRAPRTALLLAGAALSSLLSAAVSLLLLLNEQPLYEVFAWLMGGLSGRSWPQLRAAAPLVGLGIGGLLLLARPLDALACGEEAAQSLGLPLGRTRAAVVAAASLTTAATVAGAGIIGFIGLIAPHIARLLVGAGHARLIPASALVGAILLLVADTAARSVAAPLEIPVGVITALLGGPFFLVLLKRHSREE